MLHNIPDGSTVVEETLEHNHNCDTQTALVHQKVSNTLKRKAVNCLRDKLSKIIRRTLMEDGTSRYFREWLKTVLQEYFRGVSKYMFPFAKKFDWIALIPE